MILFHTLGLCPVVDTVHTVFMKIEGPLCTTHFDFCQLQVYTHLKARRSLIAMHRVFVLMHYLPLFDCFSNKHGRPVFSYGCRKSTSVTPLWILSSHVHTRRKYKFIISSLFELH